MQRSSNNPAASSQVDRASVRSQPLVSVMMPAYNAERYVGMAIESLLAQSYAHWELVLVDDGSRDRTSEVVASYNDPRIQVYTQENGGEASARNAALQRIGGDLLAFLDADDLYLPDHLQTAVDFLESHPECDGVYTDGFYIDEDGRRLKPLSSRRRGPFAGDIFEEMVRASDVFGTPLCVVLRSSQVSRYALDFDPRIVIGPDWDFLMRYAEHAYFGFVDRQTCLYRVHTANVSVRTGIEKRTASLVVCREKAIQTKRFAECSLPTRSFVFYDLLVNLLAGDLERQIEATEWAEFQGLPSQERARLLRLMASKALRAGSNHAAIRDWLEQSRRLNPSDVRTALLSSLHRLSPGLCKLFLRLRFSSEPAPLSASPFSDLAQE